MHLLFSDSCNPSADFRVIKSLDMTVQLLLFLGTYIKKKEKVHLIWKHISKHSWFHTSEPGSTGNKLKVINMWLLFDGQNEEVSDPLLTSFCRYYKASCYSWRPRQQRLKTHCRLSFAVHNLCVVACWLCGWAGGDEGKAWSPLMCVSALPDDAWRMLNSPGSHPCCCSPEDCHCLLSFSSSSSSQTPESLRTSDNGDCQAMWWSWWFPGVRAEAPSLLFGTAGSFCIAHHGPCAELFPSPALQGRWGY